MKHLIVYAHPNAQSLNGHFATILAATLQQQNHEVEVRDLYKLNFNPVLSAEDLAGQLQGLVANDVQQEQEWITWADCITFVHPIWWAGLPAMMKGYIERVFSYGFAYRYDAGIQKGLLAGKQVVIINSHGKTAAEYSASGMANALFLTSDMGIYLYCGLEIKKHFFFDGVDRASAEDVEKWVGEIEEVYNP